MSIFNNNIKWYGVGVIYRPGGHNFGVRKTIWCLRECSLFINWGVQADIYFRRKRRRSSNKHHNLGPRTHFGARNSGNIQKKIAPPKNWFFLKFVFVLEDFETPVKSFKTSQIFIAPPEFRRFFFAPPPYLLPGPASNFRGQEGVPASHGLWIIPAILQVRLSA